MSASLTPVQLISLLNDYFDVMCPIVKQYGGDIDKFIGDAIMGVFEEHRGREPAPIRACRAAVAMQEQLAAFNADRTIQLAMRIGINTGPIVRGDLGSRVVRRDYTVIGDTVNQANRYEAKCPHGAVLVSASTRAVVGERGTFRALEGMLLKGVAEPVTGYLVESLVPEES